MNYAVKVFRISAIQNQKFKINMVQSKSKPTGSLLTRLSYFLKAMYIFFPGIIFLVLGLFAFINLPQGKDIIYQSTDGKNSWVTGLYLVLATIFWVSTTWYTARLIAYDRNDLYEKAPWVLYHFPRLLGYCIFLVLWLSVFLIDDIKHKLSGWAWGITILDIVIYIVFYTFIDRALTGSLRPETWKRLSIIRNIVRGLIVASCILVIVEWQNKHVNILLYTLPVFQLGFLFLVIVRHPLYKCNPRPKKDTGIDKRSNFNRYLKWIFSTTNDKFELLFEKPVFIIYHILSIIAFVCYILCINYLPFARELTSFPLVLLGFGILLGVINFLALASHRRNINFNFVLISLIVIAGFIFETHPVRLASTPDSTKQDYASRPGFRKYLESWVKWHKAAIDTSKEYPVFFTLADGGASRSGYWAALVLGRLHEATRYSPVSGKSYFSDHLFCLSGASGGSVGNTSFLSALLIQQQHPELKTDTLAARYLDNDFLSYSLARLLGPDLIKPVFGWIRGWGDRAAALEIAMDNPADKNSYMGQVIRNDFAQFIPNDANQLPMININTTRVNDGGPAVVSNIHIDSSNTQMTRIFGKRLDVLNMVPRGKMMRVSTAMALGARFPYMSPGGKLDQSYFVDGGYFDNSGAGVVHEILLELNRIASDSTDPLSPIVKKFQYYVLHLSNTPYTIADSTHSIHPTLNDLATPLLTLAGSYNSQTSVNDARLINYLKEINRQRNSYMIMNLYQKGIAESIPMNWVISNRVRTKMLNRVSKKRSLEILTARMEQGETINLYRQLPQDN
jgi:hypothetical protein